MLFLSELFYPHGSGGELATFLYANLLSRENVNVVVITNRFGGEPELTRRGDLTVYRLPLFKGETDSVKYSILKRIDILHSNFIKKMMKWADIVYIPRFWYSAIPLAKAYRKPVLVHLHDYIPICPLSTIYDASKEKVCDQQSVLCPPECIYVYERKQGRDLAQTLISILLNSIVGQSFSKLVKFSNAIICVSKAQKDIIVKREPSLSEKIYVVYNPIPEYPSNFEIKGADFGYFGGPNLIKGFHILKQALIKMNNKRLVIHATRFSRSECSYQLSNGIKIFFYKRLDARHFKKLYERTCTVVVPSIYPEPLPYVVSEALLNGRVLIASRIGGIPEQVEGCKGVFLFEPGNYHELAEKLDYICNLSQENLKDLGVSNREVFLKRFDNGRSISAFLGICEKLI
jgi:glycosyltransferase involved in cell wall biosynthesis